MQLDIISVNQSDKRGPKFPVDSLHITTKGVTGDADFETPGIVIIGEKRDAGTYEYKENIILSGTDINEWRVFDCFVSGDLCLEIIKIKSDENGTYAVSRAYGEGNLRAGGKIEFQPRIFRIKIITLSDRAYNGIYSDRSGPVIDKHVKEIFSSAGKRFESNVEVIPDDEEKLKELLRKEIKRSDVIITTGGTGIGPKDFTVDVVKPMLDKEIPGIMEIIRVKYGTQKPNAYLSRGVAGLIGNCLVYTLPGSVKAVNEYMNEIGKTLDHLIYMQYGVDIH